MCIRDRTNPILFPVLIIFIVKELSMIIAGCVLLKKKKRPCSAKWYGKVATAMFYITFILIVTLHGIWAVSYTHLAICSAS